MLKYFNLNPTVSIIVLAPIIVINKHDLPNYN